MQGSEKPRIKSERVQMMNRRTFKKIERESGFAEAISALSEECKEITHYDFLKERIIQCINEDNNGLALHLLSAIWNSEGDSDWYAYNYTEGTLSTPKCLNSYEDVEQYLN